MGEIKMPALKPCPFCGSSVVLVLNRRKHAFFICHEIADPCLIMDPIKIPIDSTVTKIPIEKDGLKGIFSPEITVSVLWNRGCDNGHR